MYLIIHYVICMLPVYIYSQKFINGFNSLTEADSPNWIVFQPNVVIDAKLGCLWSVQLRLDPLIQLIPDKVRYIFI